MGFVPADDPKLAIVVVVDEPTVGSRYGGTVAGPAWAEIAGGALRHYGVPPDPSLLPEEERIIDAEPEAHDPGDLRLSWSGEGWTLPDLSGRRLREAVASLEPAGFELDVSGSGAVVAQTPAPGTPVPPGGRVSLVLR
jgi:cell division protein FtsI (penicillin-binding protein 3)